MLSARTLHYERTASDARSRVTAQPNTSTTSRVTVIGGGLAGTEAAWQLADARRRRSRSSRCVPAAMTPAHHTGDLAELVCSNSLKSEDPDTAAGLLKHELAALGSVVLRGRA